MSSFDRSETHDDGDQRQRLAVVAEGWSNQVVCGCFGRHPIMNSGDDESRTGACQGQHLNSLTTPAVRVKLHLTSVRPFVSWSNQTDIVVS